MTYINKTMLDFFLYPDNPTREIPLCDLRGAILTYLGCEMFNGNCFLCEQDMGGCYGHLLNIEFDNDILIRDMLYSILLDNYLFEKLLPE